MNLKQLNSDESGIAFLYLYVIITLGLTGAIYMFFSDGLDIAIPFSTSVSQNMGTEITYNADTEFVRDAITFMFKYWPVWGLITTILFIYTMAQKPERAW